MINKIQMNSVSFLGTPKTTKEAESLMGARLTQQMEGMVRDNKSVGKVSLGVDGKKLTITVKGANGQEASGEVKHINDSRQFADSCKATLGELFDEIV